MSRELPSTSYLAVPLVDPVFLRVSRSFWPGTATLGLPQTPSLPRFVAIPWAVRWPCTRELPRARAWCGIIFTEHETHTTMSSLPL